MAKTKKASNLSLVDLLKVFYSFKVFEEKKSYPDALKQAQPPAPISGLFIPPRPHVKVGQHLRGRDLVRSHTGAKTGGDPLRRRRGVFGADGQGRAGNAPTAQ